MKTIVEENHEAAMLDASVEIAQALYGVGAIGESRMREYIARREGLDQAAEFSPEAVRKLREREGASQAVMARSLGVAVGTLGGWERGRRKPQGPAAKLLALVQAHGLRYIQ